MQSDYSSINQTKLNLKQVAKRDNQLYMYKSKIK